MDWERRETETVLVVLVTKLEEIEPCHIYIHMELELLYICIYPQKTEKFNSSHLCITFQVIFKKTLLTF